jgi:tRNA(Ile)-lysidine synthase
MNNKKLSWDLKEKFKLTGERPIVVGVSGGPDSLCLLDLLVCAEVPVFVAHYNHRLRNDSAKDAEMVRQTALRYALPFHLGEGDVADFALKNKMSIEEAARACRYRFLFDVAHSEGAEAVAVAHSADDQVETVLMHLLRGAGISGLKGMAYRSVLMEWDPLIPLLRPLLGMWREEILAYCQDHKLNPVMDHTNEDITYFRNRLRHELIPHLKDYNLQVKKTFWRMAQSLESDYEILQDSIQEHWDKVFVSATPQAVTLKYGPLSNFSTGIQRNLFRKAFLSIRPFLRDINFDAVERAVAFIASPSRSGQMDLIDGIWLIKMGDELLIGGRDPGLISQEWPQMDVENSISNLGNAHVQLAVGWHLYLEILSPQLLPDRFLSDPKQAWFDLDQLSQPLTLRLRRAGDRFKPFGMDGHQMKLSDFFINEHVPSAAREKYPLLCSGDEIIRIPGIRTGQMGAVGQDTGKILHLTLVREE